ncbi:radical SAM protein, partial [Vibrio parahaemolyticus]|nr:radical SAM protein [Vibrio parahaemolyticus]
TRFSILLCSLATINVALSHGAGEPYFLTEMSDMAVAGCHVMAKPGGAICNIDCTYCFYLEKEALYPERNKNWRMSDETLEQFIRQHIAAQSGDRIDFAWQGGEPTMMGLPFFRRVVALCEKYGDGRKITHALQTNGILVNDEWARFSLNSIFSSVSLSTARRRYTTTIGLIALEKELMNRSSQQWRGLKRTMSTLIP